jgi:hypothetical protein
MHNPADWRALIILAAALAGTPVSASDTRPDIPPPPPMIEHVQPDRSETTGVFQCGEVLIDAGLTTALMSGVRLTRYRSAGVSMTEADIALVNGWLRQMKYAASWDVTCSGATRLLTIRGYAVGPGWFGVDITLTVEIAGAAVRDIRLLRRP